MPTFVLINRTWINLDTVTRVDVQGSMADPNKPSCLVHFAGKDSCRFDDAEAKQLIEFLSKHQAQ